LKNDLSKKTIQEITLKKIAASPTPSFNRQIAHCYCERYSKGTLLRPGMRLLTTRRKASTLVSPRVKAMIEPIITPQMPPIAMPSRNIRLRKNVNIDHLFQKIYLL
jgi:hypothetical protein